MFSYGKPRSSIANTAQVLTEAFPYAPSSLSDVHAGTTAASDTIHNILRLSGIRGWCVRFWVHVEQSEMLCTGISDNGDDGREWIQQQRAL